GELQPRLTLLTLFGFWRVNSGSWARTNYCSWASMGEVRGVAPASQTLTGECSVRAPPDLQTSGLACAAVWPRCAPPPTTVWNKQAWAMAIAPLSRVLRWPGLASLSRWRKLKRCHSHSRG